MGYKVKSTRAAPGQYVLTFGRGGKKLTGSNKKCPDGWLLTLDWFPPAEKTLLPFETAGKARAAFFTLAVAAYNNTKPGPAAGDEGRSPSPAASHAEASESDEPEPLDLFVPHDDFERGLLAAARCAVSSGCLTMTRTQLAEAIIGLGPLRHSSPAELAREIRQLLLAKPSRGRRLHKEVAHAV